MQNRGVQESFLYQLRKQATPVNIYVVRGFEIKNAIIKAYDNFSILCEVDSKQMLIYKHAISTIAPHKHIEVFSAGEESGQ